MNLKKFLMLTGAGGNPLPPGLVSANLLVLCLRVTTGIGSIRTKFTQDTLISFFLGLVLLGSVEFFICHSPTL